MNSNRIAVVAAFALIVGSSAARADKAPNAHIAQNPQSPDSAAVITADQTSVSVTRGDIMAYDRPATSAPSHDATPPATRRWDARHGMVEAQSRNANPGSPN